ncbi:MAG: hypothetical protein WBA61_05650 [Aequorivita sp.]
MATVNKTSSAVKKSDPKRKLGKENIISAYMEWVLLNERTPKSVFKFCKENNFEETGFYEYFGSFEGLQMEIWNSLSTEDRNIFSI